MEGEFPYVHVLGTSFGDFDGIHRSELQLSKR